MMGNRSILFAVFGLFALVVAISKLSNKNTSPISDHTAQDLPVQVQIQKKSAPANSEIQSEKSTKTNNRRRVSSEPTQKMQRKFHLPQKTADVEEIVNQKPVDQDLEKIPLALKDRHWKIWSGVTSVPEHIFQNRRNQSILGRINGFILTGADQTPRLESFSTDNPVVIYNDRLEQPGIITGKLKIKLKYKDEVQDVLKDYNLNTVDSFADINLYYVTSLEQPFNLAQLFQNLSQDNRIESIEAEVLDRQYEKR